MNHDQFWTLIERSREHFRSVRGDGNMDGQEYALRELLLELSAEDLAEFDKTMLTLTFDAYNWTLWGAADLLHEGSCTDDTFTDFRVWLISMGRQTYEEALAQPDSLASAVSDPTVEAFSFEEFQYIPSQVYEELTGKEISDSGITHPREPRGEKCWETMDDLKQQYPRIWAALEARK